MPFKVHSANWLNIHSVSKFIQGMLIWLLEEIVDLRYIRDSELWSTQDFPLVVSNDTS